MKSKTKKIIIIISSVFVFQCVVFGSLAFWAIRASSGFLDNVAREYLSNDSKLEKEYGEVISIRRNYFFGYSEGFGEAEASYNLKLENGEKIIVCFHFSKSDGIWAVTEYTQLQWWNLFFR